ncbi:MAG: hypothetical protein JNN17_21320 [Verrucomicrobiaceae bacterium]|nr:hypothetical protein [Verrucomicrobiaceae bacterium]
MRTNVVFRYPAEFVPLSFDDGVVATAGAQWFLTLLSRLSGVVIDGEMCQEDWGVVVFVRRCQTKFWIGLSAWSDGEGAWLAHFHHGSFPWLKKFSSSGREELRNLLVDFHHMLVNEPTVSDIVWHQESQMTRPNPESFDSPVEN